MLFKESGVKYGDMKSFKGSRIMNILKYIPISALLLNFLSAAHHEEEKVTGRYAPTTCLTLVHNGKQRNKEIIEVNVLDFYIINDGDIKEFLLEIKKKNPDHVKIQELGNRIKNSVTNLANDRKQNKCKLREDYQAYKKFVHKKKYSMRTDLAKSYNISPEMYVKMVDKLRHFIYQ